VTITGDRAAGMSTGLAARLAEVLTAAELAELAALIGPDEREHAVCAEVTGWLVAEALERGRAQGWLRCMGEIKAIDAGLVADLKQERVRWHRCCPACVRAARCRPRCKDCRAGSRVDFGKPMPGEYAGGPVPAW
jgi:hypothetical protein